MGLSPPSQTALGEKGREESQQSLTFDMKTEAGLATDGARSNEECQCRFVWKNRTLGAKEMMARGQKISLCKHESLDPSTHVTGQMVITGKHELRIQREKVESARINRLPSSGFWVHIQHTHPTPYINTRHTHTCIHIPHHHKHIHTMYTNKTFLVFWGHEETGRR